MTTVPSRLGNKLESEIEGPGKTGSASEAETRRVRSGAGGVNQDWRTLLKMEGATSGIT